MMAVHRKIPLRLHFQIDETVFRKQRQHMIQEADAGMNLRPALSVYLEFYQDLGLPGDPLNLGLSHSSSSSIIRAIRRMRRSF